jgi:hypothetical protein
MPRRLTVLILGLSVLAAIAAPAAAEAAGGSITITGASSPTSNPGLLSVTASATTPINSLTVHIYSGSTDELDLSGLTLTQGTATDGTWIVPAAVTTSQLPVGTYSVTVDATDTGGDSVTGVSAGTLAFVIQPLLAFNVNTLYIDYDNPDLTFSGQLTGLPPGSSTYQDLGGVPIYLVDTSSGISTLLATTASDGSYRVTIPALPDTYSVEAAASTTVAAAQSRAIGIEANLKDSAITAKLTPSKLRYGQTGNLTGTATYLSGSTWKPIPETTVDVEAGGISLGSVQTNASGQFSIAMPTTDGPTWLAYVSSPWFRPETKTGKVNVAVPMTVSRFSAKLSPLGYLAISGCVKVAVPDFGGPQTSIQVQYSRGPHGPWKRLGKLALYNVNNAAVSCDKSYESSFAGRLGARLANAYYRAYYPATAGFLRTASTAVHAWKYLTRITSFSISPRAVASGGSITITGRLWRQARSWRPYGHRRMLAAFYVKSQGWTGLKYAHTNSSGWFTETVAFSGNGHALMSAYYFGDTTHLWSKAPNISFTVGNASARSIGMLRALQAVGSFRAAR